MTFLGKATNINLKRNIKGTNTLTFDIPQKYFDSKTGDYVKNELVEELYNERKIKLKYDDNWYEFYIKSIQEQKNFKTIIKSITCEDSFIDELSRTGWEIEFNTDLYNSVNEVGNFMDVILKNSIWDYVPVYNNGDFTEFKEQRFYKIPLSQFGGQIIGYPIDLEAYTDDINNQSDWYLNKKKENNNTDLTQKQLQKELEIKNVFNNKKRNLQYGDDNARILELFWDPYKKDNGHNLLDDEKLVTLSGDYIYVPIVDLQMITGSLYSNSKKAIEEPALYGSYEDNIKRGYALQPYSTNPEDLIQFIFFNDKDKVLIDEGGVLANNDCHYVIKIKQWDNILRERLKDKTNGVIYWTSPIYDEKENYVLTSKYQTKDDIENNIKYSFGVLPNTRTIDNFCWYPVYYEDYLSEIDKENVSMARKISIANRTEFNINEDMYVSVYNQNDNDFSGIYSNDELNDLIVRRDELRQKQSLTTSEKEELERINQDFRICSKLDTRQILPSLAKNLVQNGMDITDTNGWEAKTQNTNDRDETGTGSFLKIMELEVKSTVKNNSNDDGVDFSNATLTGTASDENVNDYFLEILSPYIEKSDDLSYEGQVETDYVINFGLTSQEKKIEKGKVYAIRLNTGNWVTYNYQILKRSDLSIIDNNATKSEIDEYYKTLEDYRNIINNFDAESVVINDDSTQEDLNKINQDLHSWLLKAIDEHDRKESTENKKFINIAVLPDDDELSESQSFYETNKIYNSSDIQYLKYIIRSVKSNGETPSGSTLTSFYNGVSKRLSSSVTEEWIKNTIFEEQNFEKSLNSELNKIIIGRGSTNLQGNYIIDGIDNKEGDFINFSDLFEPQSDTPLVFLPKRYSYKNDNLYLTQTLYNIRNDSLDKKERWNFSTNKKDNKYYVEDKPFLLFKAKEDIENPYIAIRVDSEPAYMKFDSIVENFYKDTNNSGVKIQVITPAGQITLDTIQLINEGYMFVNGCSVKIYPVSSDNFSSEFLDSINYNSEEYYASIPDSYDNSKREYGELKDGDLLSTKPWSSASSSTAPLYYSLVSESKSENKKSIPYALFIDDIYYGIFWLNYKKQEG